MSITAEPLCWPTGWKRTPRVRRKPGPFGEAGNISISSATRRLRDELRRLGVHEEDIIVSSNLRLRLDGQPYSQQPQPSDSGVAVYWREARSRAERCMAIDLYSKIEQNIAALARTIEAMRASERHGGAAIIERAFTGFTALPAPGAAGVHRPWHEVLDVSPLCTLADAREAFMRLRSKHHPDKNNGAPSEAFVEVTRAWDEAVKELNDGQ